MSRIRVRNPAGVEQSFETKEEFSKELGGGGINAEWEIFHSRTSRWLSVAVHPAFQAHSVRAEDQTSSADATRTGATAAAQPVTAPPQNHRHCGLFSALLGQRPPELGQRNMIVGA